MRKKVKRAVQGAELTPVTQTRLRFLRHLFYLFIVVVIAALLLAQFTSLNKIAAGLLASGAIAAAIVGFAAQQLLANVLAGVTLAVGQPFRIGDYIEFDGSSGTVAELRLTHTFLRTSEEDRVIIPNARIVSGIVRNRTILDPLVEVSAKIWLSYEQNLDRSLAELRNLDGVLSVSVSDTTHEGIELTVRGRNAAPDARGAATADLRAKSLRLLQEL